MHHGPDERNPEQRRLAADRKGLEKMTIDQWNRVLAVNLTAPNEFVVWAISKGTV